MKIRSAFKKMVFIGSMILMLPLRAGADESVQTYTFDQINSPMEYGLSKEIGDKGEIDISFEDQYKSIFFEIPEDINPTSIKKMTFDIEDGDVSALAFKFHTQEDYESDTKQGTPVSYGNAELTPDSGKEIKYFSIMSLNGGQTKVSIKSVTFTNNGDEVESVSVENDIPSLRDVVEADFDSDFIMGTSLTGPELNDEILMELTTKHFNGITLGNELKPDSMFGYSNKVCPGTEKAELNGEEIIVPKIQIDRAETYLNYLLKWNEEHPDRKIRVRGHVLTWHSQTPEWFFHEDYDASKAYVSKEEMNKRHEWYIREVLTHYVGENSKYKDLFYGWDVVNEAVSDGSGSYRNAGENSSWWAVYESNEFITNAFVFANKYAPASLELYYNDYNDCTPRKVNGIVELLKAVKATEGARIDGMGMQGHYDISYPTMAEFEDAAIKYSEVVGKVMVTELDIKASKGYDGSEETLYPEYIKQAYRYKDIYETMKRLTKEGKADFTGMIIWGVIDKNSWLQAFTGVGGGVTDGSPQCPLLFDDYYHAKPAYWAIVDSSKLPPLEDYLTEEEAKEPGQMARLMKIPQGSANIDGQMDEAWEQAVEIELDRKTGDPKASATVRLMWDEENLYVYANIIDEKLNKDNEEVHKQDSIEIFIDEENAKSSSYNDACKQYRINYDNEASFNGEKCSKENLQSVTNITDKGYSVEAAIKWTEISPKVSDKIGIDIQINDTLDGEDRIGTLNWNDTSDRCWSKPSCFGMAILEKSKNPEMSIKKDDVKSEGEEVNTAADDKKSENIVQEKKSSAKGVVAGVIAIALVAVGALVFWKKKK